MKRRVRREVVSAALILMASAGAATSAVIAPAEPLGFAVLELRAGPVTPSPATDIVRLGRELTPGKAYVVQLDGPMTPERRAALSAAGLEVGSYLPENAFVVTPAAAQRAPLGVAVGVAVGVGVAGLPFVTWIGEYQTAWKIDPAMGTRALATPERQALAATGKLRITVSVFPWGDAGGVVNAITAAGGVITDNDTIADQWFIEAEVLPNALAQIAAHDSVEFIEEAVEATFRNDSNRWILQSNVSNQTPVWNAGLTGQGQIAGLIDGAVRESHCMFDDAVAVGPTHRKIVAYRGATGSDTHGTHTAGTLAGDATPFNTYTASDGMAFAARISFTNLSSITSANLETNLNSAYTDGARVHSNSWGDDGTTAYTSWCRSIDSHSYAKEDSLVCFAATNLSTLKTPENSVNVLAVGASGDTPSQGNFCSGGTGPTADGRRKPEVYAPGCNTTSANAATTCGTTALTGTSMACPAVTGAGVLVREYYTDGYYPTGAAVVGNAFTPSSALIKATLVNSAVDMTGITGFPSNQEGWGRLLLDNALFFPGDARKLYIQDVRNSSGLSTGGSTTYTFNVNSSAQPLKIVLVFTGPPAAVNAANPVINNIDLEVTDPTASLYRGNVFTTGQSATGGAADAKNNVEVVLRNTPAVGQYSVTVRGTAVNQGTQGYALVVTGDVSTCTGATVPAGPSPVSVKVGKPANMSVTAAGTGPFTYQWFRGVTPVGTNSPTFSLAAADFSDAGSYTCNVTNACGNATSSAADLTVLCTSDHNGDGFSDAIDYDQFIAAWLALDLAADYNADEFVDAIDYDIFVSAFIAGC